MKVDLGNKMLVTPLPVLMIGTYDENGVPNLMNAAWGVQSDYHEITIFIDSHKTTDNLMKTGEFTVSFATKDTVVASDYFGIESGRNVDKIAKAGFHAVKAPNVNAPLFEEYPVSIECRMKSLNENMVLVGEVVALNADESVLTDGKVDLSKLQPIMFDASMNCYRVIGEEVAKAFNVGLSLK